MDTFNTTIRQLLKKHIGDSSNSISAHSFRAGLPSILAKHPSIADDADIRGWGRGRGGESHKRYTRLDMSKKRAIYGKVLRAIQADPSCS